MDAVIGRRWIVLALLLLATSSVAVTAAPQVQPVAEKASENDGPSRLVVATMELPPFSMRDTDGDWIGITIELWEAIAERLGLDYVYRELTLPGALQAIESNQADIGAAAFSVTADRAKRMDFTHTYFGSDLGIATSYDKRDLLDVLLERLFSLEALKAVLALVLMLLVAGTLVWVFERRKNPTQFGGKPITGLAAAFWWSAVTMTTVGYGDKSPVTLSGRSVAFVWMFSSIIIISLATGAFATAMTVHQLSPRISGPQDLKHVSVGTLADSVADDYLKSRGIKPRYFDTVREGLQAIKDDKLTAFVIDHAIISYWVGRHYPGEIDILKDRFEPTYLGLAMPFQQPYRRAIDLTLLDYIQSPAWDTLLAKYRAAH